MKISRRLWVTYLLVVPAIAMVFALLVGLQQSLWFDETYSILLSRESVSQLMSLTAVDAHPPLYYLYLKLWAGVFGYSELSLRLSSVVPFGLSIVGILVVLRQFFSRRVVMIAGLSLLFAPFFIRYGYEVRMYALAVCIGAWATYVLVRARASGSGKLWALYGLLVALGLYTVYMSAVFWLWHVVWLVWMQYGENGKILPSRKAWLAYLGAAAVFAPWLPTVIDQLRHSALPGAMSAVTLDQLVHLMSMLTAYTVGRELGAWLSMGLVVATVGLVVLAVKLWTRLGVKQRVGLVLVLLGWTTSLVFFAIISLPPQPPRFMERYMVLGSISFYVSIGIIVALALGHQSLRRYGLALGALLVLIGAVGNYRMAVAGNFNFQRMQRPYASQMLPTIGGCDDTTIIVKSPYEYIDTSYYLKGCDVRFYQEYNPDYRGGYAMLHDTPLGVTALDQLTASRVVVVDPHEEMATDGYDETKSYPLENITVREYRRR